MSTWKPKDYCKIGKYDINSEGEPICGTGSDKKFCDPLDCDDYIPLNERGLGRFFVGGKKK